MPPVGAAACRQAGQGALDKDAHAKHKKENEEIKAILPKQTEVRQLYEQKPVQLLVAGLIGANFLVSAIQNQILPDEGSPPDQVFGGFEFFFNVAFSIELLVNMYGSFFFPFWSTGWNWFDFIIVGISLMSMSGSDGIPGISVLRLFRAFRVFRLFKRVKALRIIIEAVLKSLPGVANAFVVLGLIMSIWSIMAVEFFRDEMPDHFGNFFLAILTFFQIMTLDGWCSNITRVLVLSQGPMVAGFFLSYVFINAIMMANVVVAILLEKFITAMNEEDERDKAENGPPEEELAELRKDKAALLAFEEMTMARLMEVADCLTMAENHLKVLCPNAAKELLHSSTTNGASTCSPKKTSPRELS